MLLNFWANFSDFENLKKFIYQPTRSHCNETEDRNDLEIMAHILVYGLS